MARSQPLKVYRTAIGFHDAYVAATSQKEALKAWGSDADLFARGLAERVTDEALAEAALKSPGTVIKRLRGSAAEHLAALPRKSAGAPKTTPAPQPSPPAKQRRAPKPSRAKLERAEAALNDLKQQQAAEAAELERRERALADEHETLARRHDRDRRRLEERLASARAAHADALDRWIATQR